MKCLAKIAVCLAGGLVLNAGLQAASPAASPALVAVKAPAGNPPSDNPYATIAVRNIFGLNPPAPPAPVDSPEKNLPKITPTGIMGVFGHSQVLFKVAPVATKGGPPPKDEFYILSEGQRQDDIEVVKIDERNSLVTFDNHGFQQEMPLAAAASGGGAGAASWSGGGGAINNPGMAAGAGGGGPAGPAGFTRFGSSPGGNNGGMPNSNPGFNGGGPNGANGAGGASGGLDFGAVVDTSRNYQPTKDNPPVSAEAQVLQMEYHRMQAQKTGSPQAFLIPPTPLTELNTPDGGPPAP
jgi:hypothetical protein